VHLAGLNFLEGSGIKYEKKKREKKKREKKKSSDPAISLS